jgi:hypothetical protein
MKFPLPGANGIKVWRRIVYVSNTSTRQILTIPIKPDGGAGKITARFHGIQADDFAFAADGDLYIALNPLSELLRVSRNGAMTKLATHADGLQNTSAVAFDPRPGRRTDLYITNSSYFGSSPSLQEMTAGTVGYRLP